MYTYCTIQWLDDKSEIDVIIKSSEEVDEHDDQIFYYGLSPDFLRWAMSVNQTLEDEWRVIAIHSVSNELVKW